MEIRDRKDDGSDPTGQLAYFKNIITGIRKNGKDCCEKPTRYLSTEKKFIPYP